MAMCSTVNSQDEIVVCSRLTINIIENSILSVRNRLTLWGTNLPRAWSDITEKYVLKVGVLSCRDHAFISEEWTSS